MQVLLRIGDGVREEHIRFENNNTLTIGLPFRIEEIAISALRISLSNCQGL